MRPSSRLLLRGCLWERFGSQYHWKRKGLPVSKLVCLNGEREREEKAQKVGENIVRRTYPAKYTFEPPDSTLQLAQRVLHLSKGPLALTC